ncbi:cysteine-rich small domain-containing protein [Oscillospiraceae bacterium OttesenSCG-928-F05]|nr:cysteine-rich small domain-containing protein [Oscillospiraceae bacterium OttesenSCG-928-F05]
MFARPEAPCEKCHDMETLYCLFCYCPLYGTACDGDYRELENGTKDCSACTLPHTEAFILEQLEKLYPDTTDGR